MTRVLCIYVLGFFLYSFAGWIWESIFCSFYNNGHFTNRGFLNGPYCPIYGSGALCGSVLLKGIDSSLLLFFCAGFLCCSIEYVTSYVMEKLFHARWWDYSSKPLNLHGRVYLNGFLAFGIALLAVIKVINPILYEIALQISDKSLVILSCVTLTLFKIDLTATLLGFSEFHAKLSKVRCSITDGQKLPPALYVRIIIQNMMAENKLRLSLQEIRMLWAYPMLRSIENDPILKEIRSILGVHSHSIVNAKEDTHEDTFAQSQLERGA